ncbi:MAG TPA: (d)CMP kinase [Candidatus Dormibacteraeota bacterium]|nr:(d)CMP kinase [Candidatus Dormibacteraeota bacterium]
MTRLAIAIDGPAGSGKSTIAQRVAEILGYGYIDTGAMYRAVALAALRAGIAIEDEGRLISLARETRIDLRVEDGRTKVWLDGQDVSEEIRQPEVSQAASVVSTIAALREVLVRKQQELAAAGGVVMEGRDIGSVVLPQADLKIFLTASADVRARRRAEEQATRGQPADFAGTKAEVIERDRRDSERPASPLVAANDAVIVDSTAMEREEVARVIVLLAREKGKSDPSLRPE